jgi:hypothetical protein
MKIAVILHEGCSNKRKTIEVALRRLRSNDSALSLVLSLKDPLAQLVAHVARGMNIPLHNSDELREHFPWWRRWREKIFPTSDQQLLLDASDQVLLLWDGSDRVRQLRILCRKAQKEVLLARVPW